MIEITRVLCDKRVIKKIKILFPFHKENLSSYLSPLIGQYAVKNSDFISECITLFHRTTNNVFIPLLETENPSEVGLLEEELSIPVAVTIYKVGKFSIKVFSPSLGFIFRLAFQRKKAIYRHWLSHYNDDNSTFSVFRNYKKLLQAIALKNSLTSESNFIATPLITTYRQMRNALHKTR